MEGIKKFYIKYGFDKIVEFETFRKVWVECSNKNFNKYLNKELTFEEQRANRIIDVFNEFDISIEYKEGLKKFEDYLKVYEECWKAYDDVIICFESLKEHKLGIISNGEHEQQLKKIEKIGVAEYFLDVITAGEVGVSKPNTKIFEIACARNNEKIEECCYIGDDIKSDILPCKAIGMKTILINRENKDVDSWIKQIKTLNELAKMF